MPVTLSPYLWYAMEAEEEARFHGSLVPDPRVQRVWSMPVETPSGPPGSVTVVEFTLAGMRVTAFSASPAEGVNNAISLMLVCDTRTEIDRLWNRRIEGGQAQACGWRKDRNGLAGQITPRRPVEPAAGPDRAPAARVAAAMLGMVMLDLATFEAA